MRSKKWINGLINYILIYTKIENGYFKLQYFTILVFNGCAQINTFEQEIYFKNMYNSYQP